MFNSKKGEQFPTTSNEEKKDLRKNIWNPLFTQRELFVALIIVVLFLFTTLTLLSLFKDTPRNKPFSPSKPTAQRKVLKKSPFALNQIPSPQNKETLAFSTRKESSLGEKEKEEKEKEETEFKKTDEGEREVGEEKEKEKEIEEKSEGEEKEIEEDKSGERETEENEGKEVEEEKEEKKDEKSSPEDTSEEKEEENKEEDKEEPLFPQTPSNFLVLAGNLKNILSWQGEEGLTYKIYRATSPDGPFEEIAIISGNEFADPIFSDEVGTYYYKVASLDMNGLESTPTPVKSNEKTYIEELFTEEEKRVKAANGDLTFIVPEGALTLPTTITITEKETAPDPEVFKPSTSPYLFEPSGLEFNIPASLSFTYNLGIEDSEVSNYLEKGTKVYYYNEETKKWTPLSSEVSPETDIVTASIPHFTEYWVGAPTNPHGYDSPVENPCAICHTLKNGTELWRSREVCYQCHGNTNASDNPAGSFGPNIEAEFNECADQTYTTTSMSRHPVPEGNLLCTDCHDPHQNVSEMTDLLKVKKPNAHPRRRRRTDYYFSYKTSPLGNTFCFACHGKTKNRTIDHYRERGYYGRTRGDHETDYLDTPHNTALSSISESDATGTVNVGAKCLNCHIEHGTATGTNLIRPVISGTVVTGNNNTVCFACHESPSPEYPTSTKVPSSSNEAGYPATGTYPGKDTYLSSAHNSPTLVYPGTNYPGGDCKNCHSPHGTGRFDMLIDTYTSPKNYPTATSYEAYALCIDKCHDADGPGPDVAQYYKSTTSNAGHSLDQNPTVIATTATAYLPKGAKMPCYECHNPHGSQKGNYKMFPDERSNTTVTTARDICISCHRPSDSTRPTPTVAGMEMKKLPSGINNHVSSSLVSCTACHGSTHKPRLHGEGENCNNCHTDKASHAIHMDSNDPRGPNIICSDCHDTNNYPYFKSGTDTNGDGKYDLAETDVCDTCHSPGGTYNGVNSVNGSVGAKDNWDSGVYETTTTLQAGKEKWCAGCHDESPATIQGVTAPNVIGDEDGWYPYGTGWGYYKTGHGLSAGYYPASGAPAANLECDACHDYSVGVHIDGDPRTYSWESDNYQEGYRLKSVNGDPPMDIPRLDESMTTSDFALCFECHDSSLYLDPNNLSTNFRSDSTTTNAHWYHLQGAPAFKNRWDSDWDTDMSDPNGDGGQSFLDSYISCPACHNVHGSVSPVMGRHGELISTPGTTDKVPSLDFNFTPNTFPTRAQSTGGGLRFIGPGPGTPVKNGVCTMCHNEQLPYVRTPNDLYPPRITGVYGAVGDATLTVTFSEGVFTNADASGALVPADFAFTDVDDGRTVVEVTHTAGDDFARVVLSSPLDSSDDLGVDTLSAATTSSIYDIAGNAMSTESVTVVTDTVAPTVTILNPSNETTDVPIDSNLTFIISDDESGVDWTTFRIQLIGDKGYSQTYTSSDTTIVTKAGPRTAYEVTVDPDVNFEWNEVVTVTISVDDLAGNNLSFSSWSFTTRVTPVIQTIILHPSGLSTQTGFSLNAGSWDMALDHNDGDATYAHACCGGPGMQFYVNLDDPSSFGGANVQSITIWAYVRYVDGPWPNPSPVSERVNLGYRTGTSTVWRGGATWKGVEYTDASGNYDLTSTPAYTTDSDGGPLDPADIDNLEIAVLRWGAGPCQLRVTEVWAEVDYIPTPGPQ